MKHFGNEINRIIEERRLVKKQFAEASGITANYLSQLLNRECFDCRILERMCKVLNISPGYFFDDWPGDGMTIGDITNQTVIGNATVNVGRDYEAQERIIAEKERLIKVLMKQCGLSESVDAL